jgi:hypothetical protein
LWFCYLTFYNVLTLTLTIMSDLGFHWLNSKHFLVRNTIFLEFPDFPESSAPDPGKTPQVRSISGHGRITHDIPGFPAVDGDHSLTFLTVHILFFDSVVFHAMRSEHIVYNYLCSYGSSFSWLDRQLADSL